MADEEIDQHSTHPEMTAPRVDTVLLHPEIDVSWVMPLHRNSPPHQIQVIDCGGETEQRSIVDPLVGLQHNMDHKVVAE